jgi:uncharacterized protein YdaU (DUF1376 family)
MADADTWMPLYIGDYLADTSELSNAEHGSYLLLLMHQWRTGPLPNNDVKLAAIARCDLRSWRKTIGPSVLRFFTLGPDGLSQKRLAFEQARTAGKVEKRSKAGTKGAEKRWGKESASGGNANGKPYSKRGNKPDGKGDAIAMRSHWQTDGEPQSQSEKEASSNLDSRNSRATGDPPRVGDPPEAWAIYAKVGEFADWGVSPRDGLKHPCRNGDFVDITAELAIEAAGMDEANYTDWRPLIRWMDDGIDSGDIVAAIKSVAERSSYKPPGNLAYFDKIVRGWKRQTA